MGISRQNIEVSADTYAQANTNDNNTTKVAKDKAAATFSAIELWKETPILSRQASQDCVAGQASERHDYFLQGQASLDCAAGRANAKHDSLLRGQVEVKELQSSVEETSPLNAEIAVEDRGKQLRLALMKINPCGGAALARGLEIMSTDERIDYWKKIMHVPRTSFEGDFAATQIRVEPHAAVWARGLPAKTRKEIEQLFYDYGYPITSDWTLTDRTRQ